MNYREQLYRKYHSQHTGRHTGMNARLLQSAESAHFEQEWGPILKQLKRNASILDVGCGNGSMLRALEKLGFGELRGIDISEEQIGIARNSGLNKVEVADALTFLRDKLQTYDAVTCMDLAEHLTKPELVELLSLIAGALKPGGRLFIRTPNMDSPWPHLYASGDFTHETLFNSTSIVQLLESAGFKQIQVYPSLMRVRPWWKEMLRELSYRVLSLRWRIELFATARSSRGMIFSPNLLVSATNGV
jgi:2-polyprenyl-3-methyl-5-hydroxy-6-metoxy-1,4-benzoquinol methylase